MKKTIEKQNLHIKIEGTEIVMQNPVDLYNTTMFKKYDSEEEMKKELKLWKFQVIYFQDY